MPITLLLTLSIYLFFVGLTIVLTKPNVIFMLMGIEFMLSAANLNFVVFNEYYPMQQEGQVWVLFSIAIAVCEIAVLLAIALQVYYHYHTINLRKL